MTDLRLPHSPEALTALRRPTVDDPLRVLLSGCMLGQGCGIDGTDYGMKDALGDLVIVPTIKIFSFCPEDFALGTPRRMPDIHGGDGFDVLDGKARVLDDLGTDISEKMMTGGRAMLDFAKQNAVELAILTDMSGACGSQVISDGCRLVPDRRYRIGVGVATATLLRGGIPCVSQRDKRTLGILRSMLDPAFQVDPAAIDHHQTPWYREYFSKSREV